MTDRDREGRCEKQDADPCQGKYHPFKINTVNIYLSFLPDV